MRQERGAAQDLAIGDGARADAGILDEPPRSERHAPVLDDDVAVALAHDPLPRLKSGPADRTTSGCTAAFRSQRTDRARARARIRTAHELEREFAQLWWKPSITWSAALEDPSVSVSVEPDISSTGNPDTSIKLTWLLRIRYIMLTI